MKKFIFLTLFFPSILCQPLVIPLMCTPGLSPTDKTVQCIFDGVDLVNNDEEMILLDTTPVLLDDENYYEIKFDNSTLPHLPQKLFEQVVKLRTMRACDSGVEELQENVFASAQHLRKLFLAQNKLEKLGQMSFKGADDLGLIDLSFNRIETIGQMTFEALKYLSYVNLSYNQIDFVHADLFKANSMLLNIDLSHNKLMNLELQLGSVTSVDASYNMIQNFWMEQVEAKLNNQYYSKFYVKIFLSHNHIQQFKVDKRFKVRHLALDYNNITDLSGLRDNLPDYVEILDLSYNDLGLVNQDTFQNLFHLRNLYMHHTHIKLTDPYVFLGLVNLTELDLSFNHLELIPSNAFINLKSIELLKLDGNNLTELDVDHFPEKAFAVSLFHNDWQCEYLEKIFDKLREHNHVHVPPIPEFETESTGANGNSSVETTNINGVSCIE